MQHGGQEAEAQTDLNKVTLAAASGAFQEADTSWNPSFESRMFLRLEDGGSAPSVSFEVARTEASTSR